MNKMFNFNVMPYKRSGRTGGKSVSMVGMLVFLLAALLVLPSCFDDDTEIVTETQTQCDDGTIAAPGETCPDPVDPVDPVEPECDATATAGMLLLGGAPNDTLCGSEGNDEIDGMGGSDTITGNGGDDVLRGGSGPDMIFGGAGNDKIDGGPGDDDLEGNEDGDELTGGGGNNMIDGGEGEDIAIYLGSASARVDLAMGEADHLPMVQTFDNRGGTDSLTGIENVKGSHGKDRIIGDEGPNLLKGLDGADTINGGAGDDRIIPNRPANPGMAATAVENTADDDATTTTADGVDTVNGGADEDTVSYEGEDTTVTVDLSATGFVEATPADPPTAAVPAHFTATVAADSNGVGVEVVDRIIAENTGTSDDPKWVSTVENVTGGTLGDTLTGDDRNNILVGGFGGDTLTGGKGNDRLYGDQDIDTLHGGEGDDVLDGGVGVDTVNGNEGSDTIYGGVAEDGTAQDTIDGGVGVDTVSYAMVTKDTNTTAVGDQGVTITTTPTNVEKIIGSPLPDNITNTVGIIVEAGDGKDTLVGSTARDMLLGGGGDDTISGGGCSGDTCHSADEDFSKAKADVLAGQGGNDSLTGADGSIEVFAVHSGGGNDTITMFKLKEDHLHFLGFAGGDNAYSCARDGGSTTGITCTLGDQTVKITVSDAADFSTPLDLKGDLNIVVDPNG